MPAEGYTRALQLLHQATTPAGILASFTDVSNYRRIWARDAVMCGLAGLVAGDDRLTAGFKTTLQTLAASQGPDGQIPSNVAVGSEGRICAVSLGQLVGRVDTNPWFVIGVCNYGRFTGDQSFVDSLAPSMQKALDLLTVWEFNRKGLVYVPQGGDWADEYVLHGYLLSVQLLRLWALRCHHAVTGAPGSGEQAGKLAQLIRVNYWPLLRNLDSAAVFHRRAYQRYLAEQGEPDHWLAALRPGGYAQQFDTLSNALSVLLDLPEEDQRRRLLDHGQAIRQSLPPRLMPGFWPPILEGEPEWLELQASYGDKFSNYPHQYQNGGVWPMVSGWWGLALSAAGRRSEAGELLDAVDAFHQKGGAEGGDWGFYEYGHARTGATGGTRLCSWSAAAAVLLRNGLEGRRPFFG
jgi:hypothetical protein